MSTGSQETGSVVNAFETRKASKKALDSQMMMNAQSLAEQKRQFDANQSLYKPYVEQGAQAMGELSSLQGFNGDASKNAAMDRFKTADPGRQYAIDQANQGWNRSAAAKGGMMGNGGFAASLQANNQNLADQQFGNYYNRLMGIAGIGRGSATQLANTNTQYGNTVGGIYGNMGNQYANSYMQQGQAIGNMANSIGKYQQEGFNEGVDTAASMYGMSKGAGK